MGVAPSREQGAQEGGATQQREQRARLGNEVEAQAQLGSERALLCWCVRVRERRNDFVVVVGVFTVVRQVLVVQAPQFTEDEEERKPLTESISALPISAT
jgi:hypothetical protein